MRRPRPTPRTGRRCTLAAALAAVLLPALALPLVTAPAATAAVPVVAAAAALNPAVTYTSAGPTPPCPAGRYVVPAGIRFVRVVATGGAGSGGGTYSPSNDGGPGGSGATVTTILPVSAGQSLTVVAGRSGHNDNNDFYSGWPDGGTNGYNLGQGGGSSFVTSQPLVASTGCQDIATSHLDRSAMLVLAGGGGGGGGASTLGSGGNGGNAGANFDLSGQPGSTAYHLDSDCGQGTGGGGGYATGPGTYGVGGCSTTRNGKAGDGFYGGHESATTYSGVSAGGAGGGGWYGGGLGGPGSGLGGGGGGAGSSYVGPTARTTGIRQASTVPAVTITALLAPTTTATTGAGDALVNWYTSPPTITLTGDAAGGAPVDRTYYAIDNTDCSYNTAGCTRYTGPFTVGPGLHTLTTFTVNAQELDGVVQTQSFVVASTSANVTASALSSGTNPTASAGGPTGTPGTVSVAGAGTGAVGAAIYAANPAGATTFDSTGAFAGVSASRDNVTAVTVIDCNLNGGTLLYYWTGTAWNNVGSQVPGEAAQTYDPTTHCVTATLSAATYPNVHQLSPVFLAAGRPPTTSFTSTTPTAPVVGGTYTPTATASSGLPVTLAVTGTCTLTSGVITFTHTGTCTVTASQAGSSTVPAAIASTQTITVGPAAQTITFTTTPPTNPRVGGTYTPAATGGNSGQPVTFGVTGGDCTLSGGVVTFTHTGTCTITADQGGTADYTPAPQVSQRVTVSKAVTTTTVTTSPTPAVFGEPVTFTAHVTPTPANPFTPTGTVSFYLNGATTPLATVPLNSDGTASINTSALPAGSNTFTAVYSGDPSFTTSTSGVTTFTVGGVSTTITGRHYGAIIVAAGQTVVLTGATQYGSVVVLPGGRLDVESSTINGALTANKSAALRVCGTTIISSVTVIDATGFVVVGDPADGCATNTIGGALVVEHNHHGVQVIGNHVRGAVVANDNTGTGPFPTNTTAMISGNGR